MKAKLSGGDYDAAAYDACVRRAVEDCVRQQAECGLDVLTDGEMSKPGFFVYVQRAARRLRTAARHGAACRSRPKRAAFPEYYEDYFKRAMLGGAVAPIVPMVCVGPVRYVGEETPAQGSSPI